MKIVLKILLLPLFLLLGSGEPVPQKSVGPDFSAVLYDLVSINLCEGECTKIDAHDLVIEFIDGVPPYRAVFTNSWDPGFPITIRDANPFHFIRLCHDNSVPSVAVSRIADTTYLQIPSAFFPGEFLVTEVEDATFCQGDIISLANVVGPPLPIPFRGQGATYSADIPQTVCDTLFLPEITPANPTAKYYTEPNEGGTQYCTGDFIGFFDAQIPGGDVIDTLYINDGSGCAETIIPFNIIRSPFIQISEDTISCGIYGLEAFRGPLVTAKAQYADDLSFAPGSLLNVGDEIMTDTWIYVADTTEDLSVGGGFCTFIDSFFVDFVRPVNTGLDTIVIICSGAPNIIADPLDLLIGAESGGQWTSSGAVLPDVNLNDLRDIDLSPLMPGASYFLTYTIENSGCPTDTWSSTITFNAIAPPYIGIDTTVTLCASNDINFLELLSFPEPFGQLIQISGDPVGVNDASSVDMSSAGPGTYQFDYVLPATNSCPEQRAQLTIALTTGVNAGDDNTATYCYRDSAFLSTLLSVDADPGGSYISDGFFPIPDGDWDTGSIFLGPDVNTQLVEILYIIDGSSLNCPSDTAVFNITLIQNSNAGFPMSNPIELCAGDQIGLPQLLEGESDYGNFFLTSDYSIPLDTLWTVPDMDASIAYLLPEIGSCSADTSFLNINVITPATVFFALSDNQLCSAEGCVTGTFTTSRPVAVDMRITDELGNLLDFRKDPFDNDTYVFCPGRSFAESSADTIFLGAGTAFEFEIRDVEDVQTGCSSGTLLSNLSELTIGQSYEETLTGSVCPGMTTEINGVEYGASTILPFVTAVGCDSIINIVIDTLVQDTGMISRIFCVSNGPQTILGQTFSRDTMDIIIFNGLGAGGCDSIARVDLSFTDVATGTLDTFACVGDNVIIDGVVIDMEGTTMVDFNGMSSANCDSTTIVNFTFSGTTIGVLDTTICSGGSFMKGLDTYDNNMRSGTSFLVGGSQEGCDSILDVTVNFFPANAGTLDTMICSGDSFSKGSITYDEINSTGNSVLVGGSLEGCDSLLTVSVFLFPQTVGFLDTIICGGDSFSKGLITYDENNLSGISTLADATENGCDSLIDVRVTVMDQIEILMMLDLCEGETIEINGTTYGQGLLSGMEMLSANGIGCDTLATISINEIIPVTELVTDIICPDGEVIVNGISYNAGLLNGQEIISSVGGCDSLILDIALTVASTSAIIENEILCKGETTGTFAVTSISGLTLPLDVLVSGTLVETIMTLPVTLTAPSGMSTVTLDDGNCSYETTVELLPLVDGNTQIVVTDLGMNNYSLTYTSDIIADQISWNPTDILDCSDCEVVTATVTEETGVNLLLISPEGCEILASTILPYEQIIPDSTTIIYRSDIFRPLDALNGTFYVQSNFDVMIDRLSIYDRWGNLVFLNEDFLSNDQLEGWNGTYDNERAEQGVYVYQIEYRDAEGRQETVSNSLTLIR